uniref:Rhodanese domain-containing protein n=1 Tax=Noctiluca scintillans TaxID=2966 RepID=A0A7S1AME7_NOCSC|mmetsp:Transcript_52401/g.139511  ORF Transcript_52401/g.139511 Transcript_52401/m.139511 type:complete len:128 (+) Transcript_52401:79-462(+)
MAEISEVASAPISDASILKSLVAPTVVDARDQSEVDGCKGGERIENSIHVPFNIDGQKQTDRPTTMQEYVAKLEAAKALPADKSAAVITHCGNGGRGGRAATVLKELGYVNAHNGGSPDKIRAALGS